MRDVADILRRMFCLRFPNRDWDDCPQDNRDEWVDAAHELVRTLKKRLTVSEQALTEIALNTSMEANSMGQVTNVRVQYDRKRQPAQYESAGASVEFFATVGEGEDHKAVAATLIGEAKTIVLTELGVVKPGEDASAAAQTAKAETAKPTKAAAKKAAPPQDTPRVGSEDDPTDHGQPAKANGAAAPKGSVDIPEDPPAKTVAAAAAPGLTAGEIQSFVAGNIKEKKIDVKTVKEISRKFGVERIADLKEGQLVAYKGDIDTALASFQGTADI